MSNECCICFESKPINKCFYKDYVTHIPCTCNVYTHSMCLKKADTIKCIICKKKYKVEWREKNINFDFIKNKFKYFIKKNNECYNNCFIPLLKGIFAAICFLFIIFVSVLISGYTCNILYCAFYTGEYKCTLISPDQPILYIFGVVTAPFLFCFINCCLIFVKYCYFDYIDGNRILPIFNEI